MSGSYSHIAQAPLVINETPEVCPVCGRSDAIYSVRRDMGSERYCGRCGTCRWPNPNHPRGAVLLAKLRDPGFRTPMEKALATLVEKRS